MLGFVPRPGRPRARLSETPWHWPPRSFTVTVPARPPWSRGPGVHPAELHTKRQRTPKLHNVGSPVGGESGARQARPGVFGKAGHRSRHAGVGEGAQPPPAGPRVTGGGRGWRGRVSVRVPAHGGGTPPPSNIQVFPTTGTQSRLRKGPGGRCMAWGRPPLGGSTRAVGKEGGGEERKPALHSVPHPGAPGLVSPAPRVTRLQTWVGVGPRVPEGGRSCLPKGWGGAGGWPLGGESRGAGRGHSQTEP